MDINKIDYIITSLQEKLDSGYKLKSHIDVWTPLSELNAEPAIDTYEEIDSIKIAKEHFELNSEFTTIFDNEVISELIDQIRNRGKNIPPYMVSSVEVLENVHQRLILEMYKNIKENVTQSTPERFIFRIESYDFGVIRKKYEIIDGKITFIEDLESNGKKFLPYSN